MISIADLTIIITEQINKISDSSPNLKFSFIKRTKFRDPEKLSRLNK